MNIGSPAGWEARVEAAPSSQGRAGGWSVQVRREGAGSWLYLPNSIPSWWLLSRVKAEAERIVAAHLKRAFRVSA